MSKQPRIDRVSPISAHSFGVARLKSRRYIPRRRQGWDECRINGFQGTEGTDG
jgi:hypothetical protein